MRVIFGTTAFYFNPITKYRDSGLMDSNDETWSPTNEGYQDYPVAVVGYEGIYYWIDRVI